jgi:hypothetical protein
MPLKKKIDHALFVKWRELEVGAFGIPAIIAVIVCTLVLARWCGVL